MSEPPDPHPGDDLGGPTTPEEPPAEAASEGPGDSTTDPPAPPPGWEAPAPDDPAAPTTRTPPEARRRTGGTGRARDVFEVGAQLRALRQELDAVRKAVAEQTSDATTTRAHAKEAIGWLSELLPRVDVLEQTIAALTDRLPPPPEATGDDGAGAADRPNPTPAMGWDDMDNDTARAAWEALARFVGDVLHGRYRLTRLQIPDCWPLHPRLIREIAWLRSSYLDAAAMEPDLPPAAAPWHTRALPPFLKNMIDAVDVRECRPGVHRLTEPEVTEFLGRSNEAHHQGRPTPAVSSETGVERPRYVPEAFPTRGTAATRPGVGPNPPTVRTVLDLVVGSCEPRWWLDYYREASAADLARRPATVADSPAGASADTPAGASPSGAAAADDLPSRFDLDNDAADHADGGPDGVGGLDGHAGPL